MNILDNLLLKQFQRLTDFISSRFASNNFKIAQLLQLLSFLSYLVVIIIEAKSFSHFRSQSGFLLLVCLGSFSFSITIRSISKLWSSKKDPKFVNPLKKDWKYRRLLFIVFTTFYFISGCIMIYELQGMTQDKDIDISLYKFIDLAPFLLLQICTFYLGSCTPKYED